MNLLPLAQYIEDQGLGVQGTNLFVNMIPSEAPEGILLRNQLVGTRIDYELPGYYKTGFRLIVRSARYETGEALMAETMAALTFREKRIDTLYVRYCRPLTQPVVFPISKGSLLEFAVDFDIVFME